jgi:hypothetical protein
MAGILNMGGFKITNLGAPSAGTDAATKTYVDTQDTLKVSKTGDTLTGNLDLGTNKVTNLGVPSASTDATTKSYVDSADALKLNKAGDTMSGALAMGTNKITGLGDPTQPQDAATKTYVDTADALKLNKAGDTMSGVLNMGTNKVTSLGTPTVGTDATTKDYVDAAVSAGIGDGDKGDIIVGGGGLSWTIDSGVVTNNKIGAGAVTSDKIATGAVTSTQILNGTIVDADISATAAIAGTKVESASTTVQGTVQLTDSVASTSNTTAATPNSVKQAYDLANAALPTAGGTLTGNVDNTATGYFDLPSGTTAERPISPNSGYVRFNTDTGQYEGYNGSVWSSIGGGATGGGGDQVFLENGQVVTTSYTLTASKNAVSAGPVTINSGATVTVPSGAAWVIV